jgi:transposase
MPVLAFWEMNEKDFPDLRYLLKLAHRATIAMLGISKSVFAVHGVGASGLPELLRPELRRHKLKEIIASLPPCLIGMEACSGAHHWAREFEKMGYTVRVMAAKFV